MISISIDAKLYQKSKEMKMKITDILHENLCVSLFVAEHAWCTRLRVHEKSKKNLKASIT